MFAFWISVHRKCVLYTLNSVVIKELKSTISDNQKISENLSEEFLQLTDEAEKQKDLLKTKLILAKGNSLKRKAREKLEENQKLEKALKVLQDKRKKST